MMSNQIYKNNNSHYYESYENEEYEEYEQTQNIKINQTEPTVEVLETEKYYVFKIEIDGMKKDSLEVKYMNNWLIISCEKMMEIVHRNHDEFDGDVIFSEFVYGSMRKEIPLPSNIDRKKMKAKYHENLLYIMIEKNDVIVSFDVLIE